MGTRGGEAARFAEYLERLGEAVGHADRREPLRAYVTGLLLPGERKSVEPMAAKIDPRRVAARHQSMHHFVAAAPWEAQAVVDVAREWVLPQLERHGPVAAWVVDDTGIPKKGRHSVGVQSDTAVWPPGQAPGGPAPWCGWGPHPRRLRRTARQRPLAVAALATRLPASAWERVRWRAGTRGPMESRFAAVRVRPAHRDEKRVVPRDVEWLLIEWPRGEPGPPKSWLSTVRGTG